MKMSVTDRSPIGSLQDFSSLEIILFGCGDFCGDTERSSNLPNLIKLADNQIIVYLETSYDIF